MKRKRGRAQVNSNKEVNSYLLLIEASAWSWSCTVAIGSMTTNNAADWNWTVSIGFHYAAVNVTPDVIVMAPGSGQVVDRSGATLSVAVTDAGDATYQWCFDGNAIAGE